MSENNAPENVELDAVKPEVLDLAVLHNMTKAIAAEASQVPAITAPVVLSKLFRVEPTTQECIEVITGLMQVISHMQEYTGIIEEHMPFAHELMEESDKKALKKALEVHPLIKKAIAYGSETPDQKLDRRLREHKAKRNG